jgi:hypothetical protein
MSAPVDVLAVLRYNAKEATKKWGPDNQDAATLAAVAELLGECEVLAITPHGHVDIVLQDRIASVTGALSRAKGGAA